eukprot:GFUD01064305.1.p1 GENE.GFUD01064305.1~~GFUD01064305.1.p1  ORF type:complete len:138 (-),score=55.55 GFUD01064305.1:186-599(-)
MEELPASVSTSASSPYNDEGVSFLCQREEHSEVSLPDICQQMILPADIFVKIVSMLGIFGAVVMTLALLMYFTCVRQRKGVEESDVGVSTTQVLTLAQYNVQIIQPPDYATVVRTEEEELPSYSEAVKSCKEEETGG